MKQTNTETVDDFLTRVGQKTTEYDLPPHLLVGIAFQGLKSSIAKIVMPQKPTSMEKLREISVLAERTVRATELPTDCSATTLNNMETRMTQLSEKFETSLAALTAKIPQRQSYVIQQRRQTPRHLGNTFGRQNLRHNRPMGPRPHNIPPTIRQTAQPYVCLGCGGQCQSRQLCKAYGKICYVCQKLNHYGSVCRSGFRNRQPLQ